MINSYCKVCGLYISAPDDFAGGRGSCPRCKTPLRIPQPLKPKQPDYVPGLRYLCYPADQTPPLSDRPEICTPDMGASSRYRCTQCGERYESIKRTGWGQGLCPSCGHNNKPSIRSVAFPRQFADDAPVTVAASPRSQAAPAGPQAGEEWEMDGEFLLAHPAVNQSPGDSVMEGIALSADGLEDAPGLAMDGAERYTPEDLEPPNGTQEASSPKPPGGNGRVWYYLQKGTQQGPVCEDDLRDMILNRRLNASALLWHEGLEGWQPAETFPAFQQAVQDEPPASPTTTRKAEPTPAQRSRELASGSVTVGWLFTAALCVVVLTSVARQSFSELGRVAFLIIDAVVALGVIGAIVYAGRSCARHRRQLGHMPLAVRLRLVGGAIGLLACLGWIAVMVNLWPARSAVRVEAGSLQRAQHAHDVLARGSMQESFQIIDWENLHLNGDDFGERYRHATLLKRKEGLIDSAMSTLQPVAHVPADQNPEAWSWRIHHRTLHETVVIGQHPNQSRKLVLTLRGGMVTHIEAHRAPATQSAQSQPAE
jgi:DNA-directed RNA polymerase subunit RPC12/RpoP